MKAQALSSRRAFLTGLAVLGGGAVLTGCRSAASMPSASAAQPPSASAGAPHRVDVHHHFGPPSYVAALAANQIEQMRIREWTVTKSLEDMDRGGVATSMLSITTPGFSFADGGTARRLARECNEYGAQLAREYPGRFGLFAAMPMPDVDGTLGEIAYALDTLKADGIGFFTSYGDKWLGDPAFKPVMEELNRRKVVAYTHPTSNNCCKNLVADVPPPIIEYGTDTTRTIASIVFSGTAARFPDIHWIFSHAGGTMPFLTERFTRLPLANKDLQSRVPNGVTHELKRFHYDVAQAAHPMALASLTRLVPVSQVVFGTDFPFRTATDHVKGLADYGFSASDLRAIDRDNAVKLLPRLKA